MVNKNFHVLIVDENQQLCDELRGSLEEFDCGVECIIDGANSYRTILERMPSALILDISLPDAAGVETLRRLQNHRSTRKLPIIAVSNQAEFEFELLDVFDFLEKPVDLRRLTEDLKYLRSRQREDRIYPALEEKDLKSFQAFLVKHSGLYFDRRNIKILERGLQRRMRAVGAYNYHDYFEYLNLYQDSRSELKKLIGLLTVGETSFFRYSSHREAFINHVVPAMIQARRNERTLRFWSAGCSTGEEPYSMAIILLEHFPQLVDWKIEIIATDINKRSLRRAREAVYSSRAVRLMGDCYVKKYFRNENNLYVLDQRVRDMVEFNYLNLQADSFPALDNGTVDVDCIFCRNVMIYFRIDTIREIVARMSRCLRPAGFLFLGHSETMQNVSDRFQRIHKHNAFYYQRRDPQLSTAVATPQPSRVAQREQASPSPRPTLPRPRPALIASSAVSPPLKKPFDAEALFVEAEQAFNEEDYSTASRNYAIILEVTPRHVGALLGKTIITANEGDFETARTFCSEILEIDDLCAPAYFLRGLISDMEEDLSGAISDYQRAIWLDMYFVVPHYYLSKILLRQGRKEAAERELRNSIRLLEKASEDSVIPFSGGLSRSVFLEVCRADTESARKQ